MCVVYYSTLWDVSWGNDCSQIWPKPTYGWSDWLSGLWFVMGVPERLP